MTLVGDDEALDDGGGGEEEEEEALDDEEDGVDERQQSSPGAVVELESNAVGGSEAKVGGLGGPPVYPVAIADASARDFA